MDFSLAKIKSSLQNYWEKLTLQQKTVLIGAPLLVALCLFGLVFWASRPEYVALFNKLNDNEAGAITAKLKELKVPYQLGDNGSSILVPKKDASEIRLELANAGLPKESTFSFDYLNQTRIGETDSDRRLRYTLGLQGELENTIAALDGVEYARVHIVLPEQSLFQEQQKDATAAVTIKKETGYEMTKDQVRAIANLLAFSVEGLNTENVTIVDTNGNVLSDILGNKNNAGALTADQLQMQQTIEENIQKSAQSMLDKVFGAGKTVVRANAALDYDQKKITSQKSEDGAVVSRQESTEKSTNQAGSGGVPGTASNVPGYTASSQGNSSSEKSSKTENFQPSVTQEETVVSPGQIKRLTVSVMADSDSVGEEQLANIKNVVSSAVGLDENRGDQIQIVRLPFNKTEMLQEQAAMEEALRKSRIITFAEIGLGVLIGALLLILFVRSVRKRKIEQEEIDISGGEKLITLQEAEELLASQIEAERQADLKMARKKVKTSDEIEREKIRQEVDKFTHENPEDVARLLKTWLTEES